FSKVRIIGSSNPGAGVANVRTREVPRGRPANAFLEPDLRLETEIPQLPHVRTAARRAARLELARHDADLPAARGGDQVRQITNRDLALGPDMEDGETLALLDHAQHTSHEVIDVDERPRLFAGPLDWKIEHAGRLALAQLAHPQN